MNRFLTRKKRISTAQSSHLRFLGNLEQLESREMPAVLTLASGVLTYTADTGESNNFTASIVGNNLTISDNGVGVIDTSSFASGVTNNGFSVTVDLVQVPASGINAVLGDGTDSIPNPGIVIGGRTIAISHSGTGLSMVGPLTTTLTSGAGVTVTSTGGDISQNGAITTNGANVSIISNNALFLRANINSGAGTINLAANQDGAGTESLSQDVGTGTITSTNTTANAVTMTVNTSGGGTGDASIDSTAVGVAATGGTLTVNSNAGNILYAGSTALTDNQRGLINAGSGPARTLIARDFVFSATGTGSIGTDARPIQTKAPDAATTVTATAGSGGIYWTDWNTPITINKATATGAGNIRLVTANVGGHNLTINGPVSTATGNIYLASDDNLTVGPGVTIGGAGFSGTVWMQANRDRGTAGQPITMDKTSSIVTSNTANTSVPLTTFRTPTDQAVYLDIAGDAGTQSAITLGNITTGNGGRIVVNSTPYASLSTTPESEAGRIAMADASNVLNAGTTGTVELIGRVTATTVTNAIGVAATPIVVTAANVITNSNFGSTFVTGTQATNFTSVITANTGALANQVAITSAASTTTTATITTSAVHGLAVGNTVIVAGVSTSTFNGTFVVASVPTTTSFTYALAGTATTGSGGTSQFKVSGQTTAPTLTLATTTGALTINNATSNANVGTINLNGNTAGVVLNAALGISTNGAIAITGPLSGTGNITRAGTLTVAQDSTSTYGGVISGTGGFTKTGTGNLTLSATNNYTGATAINSGTVTANGNLGTNSALTVASGATLASSSTTTIGGTGATTINGTFTPGGTTGTGIFNTGNLTFGANSILNINLNGTTAGSTGYDQINTTGTVTLNALTQLNVTLGYTPAVNDSYTIIANDAAEVVTGKFLGLGEGASFLVGSQWFKISYAGGTSNNDVVITAIAAPTVRYVDDGFNNIDPILDADPVAANAQAVTFGTTAFSSLQAAIDAASPNDTIIVNSGSYLETVNINKIVNIIFQEAPSTVGSLAVTLGFEASIITLNANLTIGDTTDTTIGALIAGTGSLTKVGAGAVTLSNAANTYTGGTNVNEGKLVLGSAGAITRTSAFTPDTNVTVASGATLTLNGFSTSFGSLNGAGTIENASATTATFTVGSLGTNSTFSGLIQNGTGAGLLNITKTGAGVLTLSGAANTYTGVTTANAGILDVAVMANGGVVSSIGQSASVAASLVLSGGATLRYSTLASTVVTDRNMTIGTGGATVEITDAASTLTMNSISGGTNVFAKTGAGKFVIAAASGLTTGLITVSTGTLAINSVTLSSARTITIATGAVLESSGTISTTANATSTYDAITGAGTLKLTSTSNSVTVPDLYFNSNDLANATTNFGTRISSKVDLGTSQRFIWALSNHNGVGNYLLNGDAVITGVITGSAGITYIAQATYTASGPMEVPLYITGANTFTGPVNVARGSVYLGNGTAINGNDLTFAPTIGNAARLYLFGQSDTIGNLNSSGAGTTQIVNSPGQGTIAPATLTINQTVDGTYAGSIAQTQLEYATAFSGTSGALSIVKAGSANLTLTGTNVIDGTLAVNAGTLTNNGSFTTLGGATVASGATLAGTGTFVGPLSVSGTITPNTSATGIINSGNLTLASGSTYNVQLNGLIAGTKYDQINVAGTVTINNATLNIMALDAAQVSPGTQLVIISNDGSEAVSGTFNGLAEGATVSAFGTDFIISYVGGSNGNDVVLSRLSPGTVTVDTSYDTNTPGFGTTTFSSINSAIAAASTVPFTTVVIDAGVYNEAVVISKPIVLSVTGNATIGSIADVAVPLTSTLNLNNFQLTLGGNNSSTTYNGTILGTGSIVKTGSGSFTITGANGFSGGTTINTGSIVLGSATALGNNAAPLTVASGATLQLAGNSVTVSTLSGTGTIDNNVATPATLTVANTTAVTFTGNITNSIGATGAVSVVKSGAGVLTLSGTNTFVGTTTVNAGSLVAGTATGLSAISAYTVATGATLSINGFNLSLPALAGTGTVNNNSATNATLTVGADNSSSTFTGTIANGSIGTLSLVKTGTGTFSSNAASTFSGGTTVSQGTIQTSVATGFGTGSITLADSNTAANNVAFLASVNGVTFANNFIVSSSGTGTATIGTADGITGAVNTQWNGTITLNRTVTLRAGSADRTTFTGLISGPGGIIITAPLAANRIAFAQAATTINNFTGNIDVQSGLFQVGVNSTTSNQFIPDTVNLNVGSTASVRFSGTGSESINALTGSGSVSQGDNAGAYALTIGAGNGSGTFSGILSMAGTPSTTFSIIKAGTGTQTFSGANTYTGTTLVNSGILVLANTTGSATGTSNVTVLANGTLSNTGTGSPSGTITSNGRVIPGGLGTTTILNSGNLALNSTGYLAVDLNNTTAGTGYDQDNVTGTVALGGQLRINAGPGLTVGNTFTIINNDVADAVTGDFANVLNGGTIRASNDPRYLFTINTAGGSGNDVVLTLTSVDAITTGRLDVSGGIVTYTTAGGVSSNLSISLSAGTYTVTDAAGAITLGTAPGWSVTAGVASGPAAGITDFFLNLGDATDSIGAIDTGTANLTLSGTNVLNVNGAVATNALTINGFTQVGGTGTIAATGNTTINGDIAPSLTLGNLNASAGAISIANTPFVTALDGTTQLTAGTVNFNVAQAGNSLLPIKTAATNLNVTGGTAGSSIFANTGGANVTITGSTGNISFTNSVGSLNLASATMTTGNLAIASADAILLNGDVNAGSGTITINANTDGVGSQGYDQKAASITTTNTTTSAALITVGGTGDAIIGKGSIGSNTGSTLTVNAGGSVLWSNDPSYTAFSASQTGLANGGSNTQTLRARVNNFTSGSTGSIGTSARPLQLENYGVNTAADTTPNLVASGGTGGVFVTDWDNASNIDLTTGAISAQGSGDIRVVAANSTGHNLYIRGNVSTGTGNIFMAADDNVDVATAVIGGAGFSGTVWMQANRDLATNGQTFLMASTASIVTSSTVNQAVPIGGRSPTTQAVYVDIAGDVGTSQATITASNITTGDGGRIVLFPSRDNSDGRVVQVAGTTLNAGPTGTIEFSTLNFDLTEDSVGTSATPIRVAGGNVVANSSFGNIYVVGTSSINLQASTTNSGSIVASTDAGKLTVSGATNTDNNSSISLTSLGVLGGIDVNATLGDSNTGSISLNAGTNVVNLNSTLSLIPGQSLSTAGNGGTIVNSGGTLSGVGTAVSLTSLKSGGTLSPADNQVGNLKVADVIGATGASFRFDITGASTYDTLTSTGTVNLAGSTPSIFLGSSYNPILNDKFTIVNTTGGVTGSFANSVFKAANNSAVEFTATLVNGGKDVQLEITNIFATPLLDVDVVTGQITYSGGGSAINNALTVSYDSGLGKYIFSEGLENITLTQNAKNAGFSGNGTTSVTGTGVGINSLALFLGAGDDIVNLVSVNNAFSVELGGSAGDVVNINGVLNTNNGAASILNTGTITAGVGSLINTGSGQLNLSTIQNIGSKASPLLTKTGSIVINANGATGDVFVTEADGTNLTVTGLGASNINVSNTTGTLNVSGKSTLVTGNLSLSSGDAITTSADIDAGNGKISIAANTDGAGAQGYDQKGATLTTTNPTANALLITINTAGGGTGDAIIGQGNIGSIFAVSNASWDTVSATITTATAHNFSVGDLVTISGITGYNGSYTITDVSSTTSFSYALAIDPGTPTLGTNSRVSGGSTVTVNSHGGNILWSNDSSYATFTTSQTGTGSGGSNTQTLRSMFYNFNTTAATGSVGTDARPIQIDNIGTEVVVASPNLVGSAGSGGFFVTGWDSAGVFDLTTGKITAQGAGNIRVVAANSGGHNLIVAGKVSTGSGSIFLAADDDLYVASSGSVGGTGNSGTITVIANRDAGNGQAVLMSTGSSIATTNATDSAVLIQAFSAQSSTGSDLANLGAGGVFLSNVSVGDGGTITVNAGAANSATSTGSIVQLPGTLIDAGPNGSIVLTARATDTTASNTGAYSQGNIGIGGGSTPVLLPLTVRAGNVSANVTGTALAYTGSINLKNTISGNFTGSSTGAGNTTGSLTIGNTTGTMTIPVSTTTSVPGKITITQGNVSVNGTLAGNAITVVDGAFFTGTGTISATTPATYSGTVNAGTGVGPNTTGTLNTGNLSFDTAGTRAFIADVNSKTAFDQLNVTGTVNLTGASLMVNAVQVGLNAGDTFKIINNDSNDAVTGTFAGLIEGAKVSSGTQNFTISYVGGDGNDVVLTRIAVPMVTSVVVNGLDTGLTQSSQDETEFSMVTHLVLNFSSPVLLSSGAAALALYDNGNGILNGTPPSAVPPYTAPAWALPSNVFVTAIVPNLNGYSNQWIVTFEDPSLLPPDGLGNPDLTQLTTFLRDGAYSLTLTGSLIHNSNNQTVAGDTTLNFYRFFGDGNQDGTVNNSDLTQLRLSFNQGIGDPGYNKNYDANLDGTVNNGDLTQLKNRNNHSLYS